MRCAPFKSQVGIDPRMVDDNAADSALGVGPAPNHLQVDEFRVVQKNRLIHRNIGQELVAIVPIIRTGHQEQHSNKKKGFLHLQNFSARYKYFDGIGVLISEPNPVQSSIFGAINEEKIRQDHSQIK